MSNLSVVCSGISVDVQGGPEKVYFVIIAVI